MNVAAHNSPDRHPAADAAAAVYRRFGWLLVVSCAFIAVGAFAVAYVENPHPTLQPMRIDSRSATAPLTKASDDAATTAPVQNILDVFVHGLANNDLTEMRSVYPELSRYDARVLRGIRRRMGTGAALHVESVRLKDARADRIDVAFAVVAETKTGDEALRLPFSATIRNTYAGWRIAAIR